MVSSPWSPETSNEVRCAQSSLARQLIQSKFSFQACLNQCDASTQSRRSHPSNGFLDSWYASGIVMNKVAG